MTGIYRSTPLPFILQDIPHRNEPVNVLMCSPDYFDIVDEKNVHMQGNVGSTSKAEVSRQWEGLKNAYDHLQERGIVGEVSVLPGAEDCEDMVFCANQTFPWIMEDGRRVVVLSNMRHASRQREVPFFETFFRQKGFSPLSLSRGVMFEGMGDVIPHPQKQLLYGGYGHRTSIDAYYELAELLQTPIITLQLVSERFYHLDTCFVPLSNDSVMLCREAFTKEGMELINAMFKIIYDLPPEEAAKNFALNAHAFDVNGNKIAILQKGSAKTKEVLNKEGFEIIELDTSEFMKSGGSVFCMKMMYHSS